MEEYIGCDYFDVVIVCVGGGSNVVGVFYYFFNDECVCFIVVEVVGYGIDIGEFVVISVLGMEGIIYGSWILLM